MIMARANLMAPRRSRTAGRVARAAGPVLVALAGLVACGGSAKPTPRPVVTQPGGDPSNDQRTSGQDTPAPGSPLQGAVVEASGTGATADEAYAQALAMLEHEVYGDDSWARDLGLAVHERDRDLLHQEQADGGRVRVLVGLERERLDGLLQELASQPVPAAVPAALTEALAAPHGMYMEALACARRDALLGDPCEAAPRPEDIAAELRSLAAELRLRERLAGGIPLDGESRPLRPLEVVVERVSSRGAITPLPGVPVMIVQPDGVDAVVALQARTDQAGVARFELRAGEPWPGGIQVALDVESFLGPLAEMWSQNPLSPATRPASVKRWSVVVTERVQGNQAREPIFAASLDRAVRAGGGEPMVALPVEATRKIAAATPSTLPRVLPALADELQGRLDVLVIAELDSEYASRMGAYRVWYEARGRVHVFDVWTGKRLAEMQDAVTATGVGDERADQAARAQLAEKLAEKLAQVPPVVR
jgi:hypothetical protein